MKEGRSIGKKVKKKIVTLLDLKCMRQTSMIQLRGKTFSEWFETFFWSKRKKREVNVSHLPSNLPGSAGTAGITLGFAEVPRRYQDSFL